MGTRCLLSVASFLILDPICLRRTHLPGPKKERPLEMGPKGTSEVDGEVEVLVPRRSAINPCKALVELALPCRREIVVASKTNVSRGAWRPWRPRRLFGVPTTEAGNMPDESLAFVRHKTPSAFRGGREEGRRGPEMWRFVGAGGAALARICFPFWLRASFFSCVWMDCTGITSSSLPMSLTPDGDMRLGVVKPPPQIRTLASANDNVREKFLFLSCR